MGRRARPPHVPPLHELHPERQGLPGPLEEHAGLPQERVQGALPSSFPSSTFAFFLQRQRLTHRSSSSSAVPADRHPVGHAPLAPLGRRPPRLRPVRPVPVPQGAGAPARRGVRPGVHGPPPAAAATPHGQPRGRDVRGLREGPDQVPPVRGGRLPRAPRQATRPCHVRYLLSPSTCSLSLCLR